MSSEENAKGVKFVRAKTKDRKEHEKLYGKRLRISRHTWKIIYCNDLSYDGVFIAGLCSPQNFTIYIAIDHEDVHSTLLHEIFHAEVFASGLRQRHDWCTNMEEQLVEMFSLSVASIFTLRKKAG